MKLNTNTRHLADQQFGKMPMDTFELVLTVSCLQPYTGKNIHLLVGMTVKKFKITQNTALGLLLQPNFCPYRHNHDISIIFLEISLI